MKLLIIPLLVLSLTACDWVDETGKSVGQQTEENALAIEEIRNEQDQEGNDGQESSQESPVDVPQSPSSPTPTQPAPEPAPTTPTQEEEREPDLEPETEPEKAPAPPVSIPIKSPTRDASDALESGDDVSNRGAGLLGRAGKGAWGNIFGGTYRDGYESRSSLVYYQNWDLVSSANPSKLMNRTRNATSCVAGKLRDFGVKDPKPTIVWFVGDAKEVGNLGGTVDGSTVRASLDYVDGTYVAIVDTYVAHNGVNAPGSLYLKAYHHALTGSVRNWTSHFLFECGMQL